MSTVEPGETADYIDPSSPYVPPDWVLWLRRHIWKIGIVFGLTYVTCSHFMLQRRPEPPPVLMTLPEFSLLDHDGAAFGPEQMRGKVWVVGFVFTSCPSVCPAISRSMQHFQVDYIAASKLEDHIGMLSITVDPERDTPEVFRQYAVDLGADLEHWPFVTGAPDAVRELVGGGFKLGVGERESGGTDGAGYDIRHSSKLALVDRFGNVRGFYSTDKAGLDELYHRALATLRAEPT
jgi:protein SCO1/2